jgi:DnaK suppressor protein
MNERQLAYFRDKLLAWREALLEEAQGTLDGLRDTAHHEVGDDVDRATREADQALELRTRDRCRKLVRKIDQALARIEDGSYGYCEETGEPIGLARLEARPVATLSVEAQERREIKERQQLSGAM